MPDTIQLSVNGQALTVPAGSLVSTAVFLTGVIAFRRSATGGEARAPLCGMGICFECRVTINGTAHARSCQIICQPGMDIRTEA